MTTTNWLFGLVSVAFASFVAGIVVGRILGTLTAPRPERLAPTDIRAETLEPRRSANKRRTH